MRFFFLFVRLGFFFSLGIKKCHLKPSGFCLYSPWISQQCCSWVHSTGSALYQGPARTHLPYWNCPRRALPVSGKWESLAKWGGQGELQVTSHSHGKPVPARTGLFAVTAHSAGTQLLTEHSGNTKPSSEDLKTVLKFLSRNEIPTRQICSKMSVGGEGRRNDP